MLSPAILLSMLALIEAAVIERGQGLSLSSLGPDGQMTTILVADKAPASNALVSSDTQAVAQAVAEIFGLTDVAGTKAVASTNPNQAAADAVSAALVMGNGAAMGAAMGSGMAPAMAPGMASGMAPGMMPGGITVIPDMAPAMAPANSNAAMAPAAGAAMVSPGSMVSMGSSSAPNKETADAIAAVMALEAAAMAAAGGAGTTTMNGAMSAAAAAVVAPGTLPDGRISLTAVNTDFDKPTSPFKPDFVKGNGVVFSDVISFPNVSAQSMFDKKTMTKAIELTINDTAIFMNETAFRRVGLLPSANTTMNNITTQGIRTVHLSFMTDPMKPLNLSHEYVLAWLETAAFDTMQVSVKVGTLVGKEADGGKNITIQTNQNGKPSGMVQTLFTTPFTDGVWHNIALQLDFTNNTTKAYYSTDTNQLVAQTDAVPNDLTGDGEYQFGILKKPTNTPAGADQTKVGFQPSGINEGMIFGGIFLEAPGVTNG